MSAELSLGEYIRRRRREQKCSLQILAERTGLSYSHLSRVENDSTVPKADTVARIAEALDGDLKQMLELADCLPRQILDRMVSPGESLSHRSLQRATHRQALHSPATHEVDASALALAQVYGLPETDARRTAHAILKLLGLDRGQRVAIENLIQSLDVEIHGGDG